MNGKTCINTILSIVLTFSRCLFCKKNTTHEVVMEWNIFNDRGIKRCHKLALITADYTAAIFKYTIKCI